MFYTKHLKSTEIINRRIFSDHKSGTNFLHPEFRVLFYPVFVIVP
jgi:hypothetical protein